MRISPGLVQELHNAFRAQVPSAFQMATLRYLQFPVTIYDCSTSNTAGLCSIKEGRVGK